MGRLVDPMDRVSIATSRRVGATDVTALRRVIAAQRSLVAAAAVGLEVATRGAVVLAAETASTTSTTIWSTHRAFSVSLPAGQWVVDFSALPFYSQSITANGFVTRIALDQGGTSSENSLSGATAGHRTMVPVEWDAVEVYSDGVTFPLVTIEYHAVTGGTASAWVATLQVSARRLR